MTCNNQVTFYIPRGYDYREVNVKCGNTAPDGSRALCDDCPKDKYESHDKNVEAGNAWLRSAGWGEM